jgi:hypothetical protein
MLSVDTFYILFVWRKTEENILAVTKFLKYYY